MDKSDETVYTLNVESTYNGLKSLWGVEMITDPNYIQAKPYMSSHLQVEVDLEKIKKEEYIILKNSRKERIKVLIKPNLEASREKNYLFKLGKSSISSDTVSFNVISKENGKNVPWDVTYSGQPISYEITKLKTKLSLKLNSVIYTQCNSLVELTQKKSNKVIKIYLVHKDSNSVEIEKTD